ncbi:hypothetical protein CAPTEDRAFT_215633 [Capitella teleta]|uniref:Peptidase M14 domain-containing protein n=1 Tax=Capitella teleta TaxID=283909 RepID=R7TBR3_CAPTE|nr:hypothetical protein CAPTEDRAFT_215633 [Capitella teleta]|eukprot:ELT88927.1 hypothetical protein CAPTEDRAFT_215633 [Capitella teleta]
MAWWRSIWLCNLSFLLAVAATGVDYNGYRVYRLEPKTRLQVDQVIALETEFDFWKECRSIGQPCDVIVSGEQNNDLLQYLQDREVPHSIMIGDVGQLILEQEIERAARISSKHRDLDFDYGVYHTLADIEQWMVDIEDAYPDLLESFHVATSYEGREIRAFKISTGTTEKPKIWLDGGIHSREWVAIANMLYMTNEIVSQYGVDPEVTAILDEVDIYLLPVFNVDGYEYTWTADRFWRKTRSINDDFPSCVGCDPNRNFDVNWGMNGTSSNPCSDLYPGPSPFSEIEVRMVADYIAGLFDVRALIAYHSYGQMYMTPYGFTYEYPPDFEDQMEACNKGNEALYAVHGMEYTCDTLINLVGPNSGSSADYTYTALKIKYSFGAELRDKGQFGFVLPDNQIIPTGEENWAFFKAFARHVIDDV